MLFTASDETVVRPHGRALGRLPLDRLATHDRILLLQGPVGPFFDRLARYLIENGKTVYKINFNAGDAFFFDACPADPYRGRLDAFRDWLEAYLTERRVGAVALFGEWRNYHQVAHEVATDRRIPVYVFEEGYIRPFYITCERHGVNGNSLLPRDPVFYGALARFKEALPQAVNSGFRRMALFAFLYYVVGVLGLWRYPHYRHHRPFNLAPEAFYWLRAGFRKLYYGVTESRIAKRLAEPAMHKRFFLVPLQVHIDSQVTHHSCFRSVKAFLRFVVESFARHAPEDVLLVIKHHPMDRGYTNYTRLIGRLAREYGLGDRLIYVHDLHLPTLLRNAAGVVTINSTVGLSALFHDTPVKTLGESVYDVPGVVSTLSLPDFWENPGSVDQSLYNRFKRYLIQQTQVNAGFYAPKDEGL